MLATLGMKELFRVPRHRVLAGFGRAANPQNQNVMNLDGIQCEEGQHGNGEEGGDGHGEGGQNEGDQEEESEDEHVDDNALPVYEAEHSEGRIFARHFVGLVPSESITGPVALHHVLKEMLAERVPEAQLPLWNIVCWSVRENDTERELLCPNLTMPMVDFNRLLHGVDFIKIPYENLYIVEEQGQALIIERLKDDGETLLLEECFATIVPETYETAESFEEAVKAAIHRCWVQYPQLANQPVDLLPDNYQLLYYTRLTTSEMREISISMEWDLFRSLLWGAFVCDHDPSIDLFQLQDAEVPLLQYWEDGN
ncbi:hypothetical protein M0R45_010679 [Rubus argutus]